MAGPIIVHSLAEARLAATQAMALGEPLTIASAPAAGAYAGVGWFGGLIAALRGEYPSVAIAAILDCADAAGPALAALRWLKDHRLSEFSLCFTGGGRAAQSLSEMAAALNVGFLQEMPPALELRRARDPGATCRGWLTGVAAAP